MAGLIFAAGGSLSSGKEAADSAVSPGKIHRFRFFYDVTISGLQPKTAARVWIPVAPTNHEQTVSIEKKVVPANEHVIGPDASGDNRVLYFEALADAKGEIPVSVVYRVERREQVATGEAFRAADRRRFLGTSSLVPVDGSLLKNLIGDKEASGDTRQKARILYDAVDARMRYDKPEGKGWGRGDARWACENGFGNCTDFHSIFIGACRDLGIPSKFEIGFTVPSDPAQGAISGYHCWAKFSDGNVWRAVDISEADKEPAKRDYYFGNLSADRVTFSTGRDLKLDPAPAAGPVNFLVYPYVEVAGKPHPGLAKAFHYEALSE